MAVKKETKVKEASAAPAKPSRAKKTTEKAKEQTKTQEKTQPKAVESKPAQPKPAQAQQAQTKAASKTIEPKAVQPKAAPTIQPKVVQPKIAQPKAPQPKVAAQRGQEAQRAPARERAIPGEGAPLAHGVGRRKTAVARVWLRRGKGSLLVNEKNYNTYFDTETTRKSAFLPFMVYPQAAKYDVEANVIGGGMSAQADAVKLGIARALLETNPDLRSLLRTHGLLSVDARVKERKKYGQKAARRKFQFVKR